MRRAVQFVCAGWLVGGCTLSVADKHACRTSADCVGDRICNEQVCVDDACDLLCLRECEALMQCGVETFDDCDEACAGERPPTLAALPVVPSECRTRWDLAVQEPDCEDVLCAAHCDQLCTDAAACGFVDD